MLARQERLSLADLLKNKIYRAPLYSLPLKSYEWVPCADEIIVTGRAKAQLHRSLLVPLKQVGMTWRLLKGKMERSI